MATWPSVAYHFFQDKEITIIEAINMREGDDKRAGDIWCHAECFKREPRTGNRLFPRNHKSCPHYWRGSGKGHSKDVKCRFDDVMRKKSESYRFAQFYHDLVIWLNIRDGKPNPTELFHISEIKESMSKSADIVISHSKTEAIDWTETRILIVDKNRKRLAENEHTMVIDISQWTDTQLADFSDSGIRKMTDEWTQLLARIKDAKPQATEEWDEIEKFIREIVWAENKDYFDGDVGRINRRLAERKELVNTCSETIVALDEQFKSANRLRGRGLGGAAMRENTQKKKRLLASSVQANKTVRRLNETLSVLATYEFGELTTAYPGRQRLLEKNDKCASAIARLILVLEECSKRNFEKHDISTMMELIVDQQNGTHKGVVRWSLRGLFNWNRQFTDDSE
jgi:hypothetical protein